MATSPYQMAQTQSTLLDSFLKQSARVRSKQQSAREHKGRMAIDFNKKAEEIYKRASKAGRKRKRSGFSRFLNAVVPIVVSIFNPIAGGVLAGVSAGNQQYQQGKFTQRQANKVKDYMKEMGLEGRYGKSFLRGNVGQLKDVKKGMNDLARAARKMKSFEKILPTAAIAGVSTYVGGKAAQGSFFKPTGTGGTMNIGDIVKGTQGAGGPNVAAMLQSSSARNLAAPFAQQLAMGMQKFAPFGGQKFTQFLKSAMMKDSNGIPLNTQEAQVMQSMMWVFNSMSSARE